MRLCSVKVLQLADDDEDYERAVDWASAPGSPIIQHLIPDMFSSCIQNSVHPYLQPSTICQAYIFPK